MGKRLALILAAVCGILAVMTFIPRYNSAHPDTPEWRVETARRMTLALGFAVAAYRKDAGKYPSAEAGLNALISPPADPRDRKKWKGPYLADAVETPPDAWGNPFVYRVIDGGKGCVVVSYGADGAPGGSGFASDISVTLPNDVLR